MRSTAPKEARLAATAGSGAVESRIPARWIPRRTASPRWRDPGGTRRHRCRSGGYCTTVLVQLGGGDGPIPGQASLDPRVELPTCPGNQQLGRDRASASGADLVLPEDSGMPAFIGEIVSPTRSQKVRKRLAEPETAGSNHLGDRGRRGCPAHPARLCGRENSELRCRLPLVADC